MFGFFYKSESSKVERKKKNWATDMHLTYDALEKCSEFKWKVNGTGSDIYIRIGESYDRKWDRQLYDKDWKGLCDKVSWTVNDMIRVGEG